MMKSLDKRLNEALEIIEDSTALDQMVALIESMDENELCLLEDLIEEAIDIYQLLNNIRNILKKIKAEAPKVTTTKAYRSLAEFANETDPNKISKLAGDQVLTDRINSLSEMLDKVGASELASELNKIAPKPSLGKRAGEAAKKLLQPKASKKEGVPRWLRTLSDIAKTVGRH
ncbi:MAG: hypothetical protein GF411_14285 [Candidatus Lokiarchaeota archaeon]|nr:hypothetical protein [Candidatus Lokiarchaeota archaeon]